MKLDFHASRLLAAGLKRPRGSLTALRRNLMLGYTRLLALHFCFRGSNCIVLRATDLLVGIHLRKATVAGVPTVGFGGLGVPRPRAFPRLM